MRGSFGGRNPDGGGMLRTVGRAVRTGINGLQDPISSSSTSSSSSTRKSSSSSKTKTTHKATTSKHALTISSTSNPVSAAWLSPPYHHVPVADSELDQWECVENYFDDHHHGGGDDNDVFGPVPSAHEVEHALLSLQQVIRTPISPALSTTEETPSDSDKDAVDVIQRTSSKGSDMLDWIEPSMQIYDYRPTRSYELERVYDAFRLLQSDPGVQRMVVSLSSDRAVWDAVLKNDAVREVREFYRNVAEAETSAQSSADKSDPSEANPSLLKWIYDNMKVKLLEIIENITAIVGEVFEPVNHDKTGHTDQAFSDKLTSTFLLTVVVLLIVVVTRVHKS